MKLNALTMVTVLGPSATRYLIQADEQYWTGDGWADEKGEAQVYHDKLAVGHACRDILMREVADKPTRRFTFPVTVDVFGDTPIDLDRVRLWLSEALNLSLDFGKEIGEGNVALTTVDLTQVKEEEKCGSQSSNTG